MPSHSHASRTGRHEHRASAWRERAFLIAAGLIVLCALFGGSSRADSMGLLVLCPALVLGIAGLLVFCPAERSGSDLAWPGWCLVALAAWMVVQLLPLPPAIWSSLPGHAVFLQAAQAAGEAQPWRPITLSPDLTLNSLLVLLTPTAFFVAASRLDEAGRRALLPALLAIVAAGMVLSILQVSAGKGSPFYFHAYTYPGFAVGFFSNRNHQAALLAMAFPMLRVWALTGQDTGQQQRARQLLAMALALLIFPVILLTGSRAGLALGLMGLLAAVLIAPPSLADWRRLPRQRRWGLAATAVAAVGLILTLVWFQRALSIERLAAVDDMTGELRVRTLPTMMGMVQSYFPIGSGFGTFDPAFRVAEPEALLKPTFFNHAHDEYIELVLTGGLPAVLVALAFAGALVMQGLAGARSRERRDRLFVRLGLSMWAIAAGASVVDYPLRNSWMIAALTLATVWTWTGAAPTGRLGRG